MLYLYDPRTNLFKETTYDFLVELTGKSKSNLTSLKSKGRKITSINCYLADEKTTLAQRKAWYEKEKYHNEVWKTIEGSDDKFLISNYGRVQRVYKKHKSFLLPYLHKRSGNLRNQVKFNGVHKQYKVSFLVAYHFLGKPNPGEVVHHKNSIVTDDFSGNLEYISNQKLGKKTGFKSRSKPVVQLDKETLDVLGEFRSAREAGRQCYLSRQAITDNCNQKTKTSGGYIFMWAEEYEKTTQELVTL